MCEYRQFKLFDLVLGTTMLICLVLAEYICYAAALIAAEQEWTCYCQYIHRYTAVSK